MVVSKGEAFNEVQGRGRNRMSVVVQWTVFKV